jgi:cell division protein FtsL
MSPPAAPAAKPATGEQRQRGPVTLGPSRGGPSKGGSAAKGQQKAQKAQKAQSKRSARQAHLTISRVEPWSVMKFSFVVSLVAFVILFVAVSVLYGVLSGLGVFDSIQHLVNSVTSSQNSTGVNAKAWFSASRILGYTALLGSLNIVLITAMSTIGSVVYNLTSRLVGGVEVTLRETE